MPRKKGVQKKVKIDSDSKLFAFLATFLSVFGFIIVVLFKEKDKYVMYYAKQSLTLFVSAVILGVVVGILNLTLAFAPIIGWILMGIINLIYVVGIAVFWFISWIYALSGKQKEIPIFGKYVKYFKL